MRTHTQQYSMSYYNSNKSRSPYAKEKGTSVDYTRWMRQSCQWKQWPFSLPAGFDAKDHPLFNLSCPITSNWKDSKTRILWVIGHVDTDDLKDSKLFKGPMRSLIEGLHALTVKHPKCIKEDRAHAAISFHGMKTYNIHSDDAMQSANGAAKQHVQNVVRELKPTVIIVVSDTAATYLLGENKSVFRGWAHKVDWAEARIYQLPDLGKGYGSSDASDDTDDKAFSVADLIGYSSTLLLNAYCHKQVYRCQANNDFELVSDMKQFNRLAKRLWTEDLWSADTETTGLKRVNNNLLTIQFAFDEKKAYILPITHKDAKWTAEELEVIRGRLAKIFGSEFDPLRACNTGKLIVAHGFKFDGTVLREWLQIPAIYHRVYDTGAAEFFIDENVAQLRHLGTPALNLEQIARYYGKDAYAPLKFSKSDRTTIAKQRLKGDVLRYMSYDVTLPLAIRKLQLERAKDMEHEGSNYRKAFEKLVVLQLSNHIHFQSTMEHRGSHTDVKWLKQLKGPRSELKKIQWSVENKLRNSKAGIKASKLLSSDDEAPDGSLFNDVNAGTKLEFGKILHKAAFFVRVLKLKPLGFRKDGLPKINKEFFEEHKDVPEVTMFSELSQIKTLISMYVLSFLKRLKTDTDYAHDNRMRASYGFSGTGTGRGNSYDPNLQNIPTHGKYSKAIKRSFAARKGYLKVKLDYSAHEVRLWGISSGDKILCALFDIGRNLRIKYRKTGDPKLITLIETRGDIHVQNVAFFHERPLESIKTRKEVESERNGVKAIAFGTIYGRGAASIARQINQVEEKIKDLQIAFFARFVRAAKWLNKAKSDAVTRYYSVSPIGRRRNLTGAIIQDQQIRASCERRGCNAPIQSIAADMAHTSGALMCTYYPLVLKKLELLTTDLAKKIKRANDIGGLDVSVHDSLEGEALFELILIYTHILQWTATIGVMQYYEVHWGIKFITPLEIDLELMDHGASDSGTWNWRSDHLIELAKISLKAHCERTGLNYEKEEPGLTKYYRGKRLKMLNEFFPILPEWNGSAMELGGGPFKMPYLQDY